MLGSAALRLPSEPLDRLQPISSGVVDHANLVVGRQSPCPKKSMELSPMSLPADQKTFRERLAEALRRRLHPHTNLHPKQLCAALGFTRNTLDNYLSANNDASGPNLLKLMMFFDGSFASEITGGVVTKLSDARAVEAVRKYHEAKRELLEALR